VDGTQAHAREVDEPPNGGVGRRNDVVVHSSAVSHAPVDVMLPAAAERENCACIHSSCSFTLQMNPPPRRKYTTYLVSVATAVFSELHASHEAGWIRAARRSGHVMQNDAFRGHGQLQLAAICLGER
jgi:hypothetical protein